MTFNRAHDAPPDDDGWGPGTDPRTGQPFERPHLRHYLPGIVFADGTKPEPCWCQRETPLDAPKAPAQLPDATPEPIAAPGPSQTPTDALTDADAARLLLVWLRRLSDRAAR